MELLQDAARAGWTSELREQFINAYDHQIGRWVLNLLAQYGLISSASELSALRKHVEARLRGEARDGFSPLVDVLSDAYVYTYREVFQERTLQRLSNAGADGEKYLFGIVRHQFFAALGKEDLSEKELLERIVQSKRPQTQETHLREAKARLWERTREALLCLPPLEPSDALQLTAQIHRHVDTITHYFFECYLPQNYTQDPSFERLLERFRAEHYRPASLSAEIFNYRARVPRRPPVQFWGEFEADRGDDE